MRTPKDAKKPLSFIILFLVLASLVTRTASASCIPYYRDRIQNLSARMIGARTGVITSAASGAIATAAILAATGVITVAGAVAAPAAALAAGGYLSELAIERAEYRQAMHAIQGARDQVVNSALESLFKSFEKDGVAFDRIQVMEWIRDADDQGLFCPVNPRTDHVKLAFPGAIKKFVKQLARTR